MKLRYTRKRVSFLYETLNYFILGRSSNPVESDRSINLRYNHKNIGHASFCKYFRALCCSYSPCRLIHNPYNSLCRIYRKICSSYSSPSIFGCLISFELVENRGSIAILGMRDRARQDRLHERDSSISHYDLSFGCV